MHTDVIFKGEKGIQLENANIQIIVLPKFGGKIASIYHKNKKFEFAFQNKEKIYKKPKLYSDFSQFDAAGLDDAFPTIDQCEVEYMGKKIIYPDHGEIWTSDFQVISIEENKVKLRYVSRILPYEYIKTISLKNNKIKIEYSIENHGDEKFPCIWAAHFLINCNEDMEIRLPKGTNYVRNVQKSSRLGQINTIHTYPLTEDLQGNEYNLSKVLSESSNHTEKYYVNNKVNEGMCSIYFQNVNLEYILKYDKEVLPYLGFWVTEGGFRGDYNCALEPTNGFYDNIDIAKKEDKIFYLKAHDKLEFNMEIEIR